MSSFSRQASACCFALFLLLDPTHPAAADETPEAPPAEPSGPAEPAESAEPAAEYKEEITVTESPSLTMPSPEAAARELAAVPGGASFVPAEEVRRGRASTLEDVLDFAPGVFVQPRFGSEEARLSIRGSGLQRTFHGRGLKLLQDGVPLNLADGGFDFQAVEPLTASHVEVYRGSNALELGAATLGGAINYVSLNGQQAPPLQGRVESGAFGYLRGQAAFGWAEESVDTFGSLTHSAQDGFRSHAAQSTQRLFGNLGYRLSADRETRFFVTAVRTDSELPGSLTKAQLERDPRQAAAGNVALDQKRDFDLYRLANRTSWRFADGSGEGARLDIGSFWAYKHLDHPIFQVLDQRSHDVGVNVHYEREAQLAGRRHRLTAGLTPALGLLQDDRFRNVGGERGARTAQGETRSSNLDLYAEDRLEVKPGLELIGGLQAAYAGRRFADEFRSDGDQSDDQDFRGVSPKLGVFWQARPGTALFANVGRSFEPPSFGELVNVGGDGLLQLEAQTATSVELGSRGQARGQAGGASWDVVLYHAWVRDELLSLNDGEGNPLGTRNADRTVHAGLEAGLDLRLAGHLRLRQVYTWSRFRFDGDPVYGDRQLAGLPEHVYRAELLWESGRGFYGGPSVEWVPEEYPVDHANTLFADPYALLGLKVGYQAAGGWAGFVEGKNLTDEVYAATTGVIADARGRDSAQFLPGDGAAVFAGLEYRW
jgi:iron complex outermembrane recepter protein